MYRYNIEQKLVTSPVPIPGQTALSMTDETAKFCIGFSETGIPLYDQEAINMEAKLLREKQADIIDSMFKRKCSKIGVEFFGTFFDVNNESIYSPKFQYDDISRNRLQEVKNDSRVPYWRSVDNKNIKLTTEQKNELYELLVLTYYTEFAASREQIDALP